MFGGQEQVPMGQSSPTSKWNSVLSPKQLSNSYKVATTLGFLASYINMTVNNQLLVSNIIVSVRHLDHPPSSLRHVHWSWLCIRRPTLNECNLQPWGRIHTEKHIDITDKAISRNQRLVHTWFNNRSVLQEASIFVMLKTESIV